VLEPAGGPTRGLLDELRPHVVDPAIQLLEHLCAALDVGEVLSAGHERVEEEPNDGKLRQLLGRRPLVSEAVIDLQRGDLNADVVSHLLDSTVAHLFRPRLSILLEEFFEDRVFFDVPRRSGGLRCSR